MPRPEGCDLCHPQDRKGLGCGDGHLGQAETPYNDQGGADEEPWSRTCPMWFQRQPAIRDIMADLDDYQSGRMGRIDDMEDPHLFYLRVAASEQREWESWWEDQLIKKASKS